MLSWSQVFALVGMVAAGALGGYVSLLFARRLAAVGGTPEEDTLPPPVSIGDAAIAGIAAAIAVPLLLVVAATGADQSLVGKVFAPYKLSCPAMTPPDGCTRYVADLMLLMAFCVVAGASAQALLASLTSSLLRRVQEAEAKADAAEQKADSALGAVADAVEPTEGPPAAAVALKRLRPMAGDPEDLSPEERRVLGYLRDIRPGQRRAVPTMARALNLPEAEVQGATDALVTHGLVERHTSLRQPGSFAYSAKRQPSG